MAFGRCGLERALILAILVVASTVSVAPAQIRLEFPESGMKFADLAGEVGGVSWAIRELSLVGSIDVTGAGGEGSLRFEASGVSVHDADFKRAVDSVRLEGSIDFDSSTGKGAVKILVFEGEFLWDRFYADLALFPFALSGDLALDPGASPARLLRFSASEIAIAGIGQARGHGAVALDGSSVVWAGDVDVPGLDRLYGLAVSEPLGERRPRVGQTSVDGRASASIDASWSESDGYRLVGEARLRDGAVFGDGPGFQIGGLSVDLPLRLGTAALPKDRRAGSIRFDGCSVQGVDIAGTALKVGVGPNTLRIEPVVLSLLGGTATVKQFEATELVSGHPQIRMGIDVSSWDLARLARSTGLPPLAGTISGSIPQIEIGNGVMRSVGEIVAEVFGGVVRARNLRGADLRSSVPSFGFDLDFDKISLADLTRVLSFGHISGVASGDVRNLEFVSWGPVAFDAQLQSTPADGVRQILSVEAVRQLSVVGGGPSDPLSRQVLKLFDEYGYKKLGFRCSLRKDVFELDGFEVRDDRHYLVVGSTLPPRVDVVTHNRTISFSEMVSYLTWATQ